MTVERSHCAVRWAEAAGQPARQCRYGGLLLLLLLMWWTAAAAAAAVEVQVKVQPL